MAGPGPIGYADYQRVVNWDGPTLIEQTGVKHTGKFQTAIVETSRYSYVMGRLFVAERPVHLQISYFTDQAGTKNCGSWEMWIDSNIPGAVQLHAPVLGPWMQMTLKPAEEASTWELFIARVFLSNRAYAAEFVPLVNPVFITSKSYKPGERTFLYPKTYWSGRAELNYESAPAGATALIVELLTGEGTTQATTLLRTELVSQPFQIVLPRGAWRFSIVNEAAGERTINVTITADTSGGT